MSQTALTINALECINANAYIDFENVQEKIAELVEVRKRYAIDFLKSNHDNPKYSASLRGIEWCNSELVKLLSIYL